MQSELEAHDINTTWMLTPLPPRQKALSSRWVLRKKLDQTGNIKYKARVVARGNEQREGLDYAETFAPVVKWSTIRLIVALAAVNNWEITHMDVVTAFLNGTINETIYMKQPPGFISKTHPHHVCHLRKSLYGLKQSPRAWYEEVDVFLHTIGCTRSVLDPNLYFHFNGTDTVIILLFVDDLLLTGNCSSLISTIKGKLQAKYRMKASGWSSAILEWISLQQPTVLFSIKNPTPFSLLIITDSHNASPCPHPCLKDSHCLQTQQPLPSTPPCIANLLGNLYT